MPTKTETTKQIPLSKREALFQRATANEKERTVELTWSTGAEVVRYPWFDEPFYEELSLDPAHVRLGRFQNGAHLIDSHDTSSVDKIFGKFVAASVDGQTGRGTIRFRQNAKSEEIYQDVLRGDLDKISVGYRPYRMEQIPAKEGDLYKRFLVTDWEPMEASLLSVAADDDCGFRAEGKLSECVIQLMENEETRQMPKPEVTEVINPAQPAAASAAAPAPAAAPSPEQLRQERAAERTRVTEIRTKCQMLGLDDSVAQEFIDGEVDAGTACQRMIERKAAAEPKITPAGEVVLTRDGRETFRQRAEEALLTRSDSSRFKATDMGKGLIGFNLRELARECLHAMGVNTRGMSSLEIATRAMHSSSDFPHILANVANKSLMQGYSEYPANYLPLVREVENPDFKDIKRAALGDGAALKEVKENGEVEQGTMSERAEGYAIKSYARYIALTRKTIINDDLQAFTRIPLAFGRRARSKIADLVWAIFTDTHAMSTGQTLFHSSHSNLATSNASIASGLPSCREKLRKQTGLDGEKLNLMGRYLVVPAEREDEAEKVCSDRVVPAQGSNDNSFARTLKVIAEARLAAAPYFLTADPTQCDMIEVAFLEGAKGVRIETENGFDVEGMKIKAALDVGVKAIDWRGFVKNAGT